MKVRFTVRADADIINAYIHGFEQFDYLQAERYAAELTKVIGLLAENPRMAAERREYDPPVRVHHHGRHFVIYKIEDDHILVVRVLGDEMDLARHL